MFSVVRLNDAELAFATDRALSRYGRNDPDKIVGACGELAFAKCHRLYPSGLFLPAHLDEDILGIQVRTRRGHGSDLYLWERDADDQSAFWALVTHDPSEPSVFRVHDGVVLTSEIAVSRFWAPAFSIVPKMNGCAGFPREDCYVVPQTDFALLAVPVRRGQSVR